MCSVLVTPSQGSFSLIQWVAGHICFQISGKLFDSGPRRSTRLAGESGPNTGSSTASSTGNGTSHSSKYPGGSKLGSVASRSATFRKGQARGSESTDEGEIY